MAGYRSRFTDCVVFVLTATVFFDLAIGLITGVPLFALLGGESSPLVIAIADALSSGNVLLFYGVVVALVFVLGYVMCLCMYVSFRPRGAK